MFRSQIERIAVFLGPKTIQYVLGQAAVNRHAFIDFALIAFVVEVDHQNVVLEEAVPFLFLAIVDEPMGNDAVVFVQRQGQNTLVVHCWIFVLVASRNGILAN